MKILFLHGWHSVVGGVKPLYLRQHGHEVANPALDDDSFGGALATAQACAAQLGATARVRCLARPDPALDALVHFSNAQNPLYGGRAGDAVG